ncbi:hypothetical protein RF11_10276 [Thelohanellus kitauei]|uniref:Uncharacterized protein n=1 Tax=Thelohanellus kitauei TaxID=669202 RepID=A0A0C2IQ85_THEKT|nr:hypothetical protein RF11_10276 [Thelohanellus kitauei]
MITATRKETKHLNTEDVSLAPLPISLRLNHVKRESMTMKRSFTLEKKEKEIKLPLEADMSKRVIESARENLTLIKESGNILLLTFEGVEIGQKHRDVLKDTQHLNIQDVKTAFIVKKKKKEAPYHPIIENTETD